MNNAGVRTACYNDEILRSGRGVYSPEVAPGKRTRRNLATAPEKGEVNMECLSVGDLVRLVSPFPGMHPTLREHLEGAHVGRILRMSVSAGPVRFLVKFEKTDAMYGLHWLSPAVLQAVSRVTHPTPH